MQERRTTIRIRRGGRAQYCSSDDLLPRDGQLANLSERGAGARVHQPSRIGERLTLTFPLPGADDALTATGIIRWSDPPVPKRHGYRAGLEWLPMEEATRNRLHAFLSSCAMPSPVRTMTAARGAGWSGPVRRALVLLVVLGGMGGVVFVTQHMGALQQENVQLSAAVTQRNATITQLAHDGQRLQEALAVARTHLSATADDVHRLDEQTQRLTGEVERLNHTADAVQQSYLQVRQQREQLMQQMLELEQENLRLAHERAHLARRLSSIPELRLAIREAVQARRKTEEAQRRALLEAKRAARRQASQESATGNQGYLVREGQQTINQSTLWIRVHEPEATP